jgi:type IX secretion system PorP/SprF family membrane protein
VKKLVHIKIALLLLVCASRVNAQVDPHFSQYYAYPLWLNPALTGIVDGDFRLTGNFKDQWTGVGKGYRTAAVSADFRTSDKVSLGFNAINQAAGSAGYNYLAAYGSFGYQIALSNSGYHRLNFGLQAGVINRGFRADQLQFDNQYNPGMGYDPTMPSFENFSNTSATVFDASAGVFYYNGTPSNTVNLFAGAAVAHLAPAKDPFANSDGLNSRIPVRITAHAGLRIRAADFLDLTPHAVFIRQSQNQIRAAGMNMEFKLQQEYSLIIGGMYRLNDAAVGNAGLHLKNFLIGVSYDYGTSPLTTAINQQGVYELSVSYIFRHRLSNREQICPRL